MSSTGQGYYFAFISFGILLQLCDFGLSYASLQAASHLLAIGRRSAMKALADKIAAGADPQKTFTAGLKPLNKLIDRKPDDNLVVVTK